MYDDIIKYNTSVVGYGVGLMINNDNLYLSCNSFSHTEVPSVDLSHFARSFFMMINRHSFLYDYF